MIKIVSYPRLNFTNIIRVFDDSYKILAYEILVVSLSQFCSEICIFPGKIQTCLVQTVQLCADLECSHAAVSLQQQLATTHPPLQPSPPSTAVHCTSLQLPPPLCSQKVQFQCSRYGNCAAQIYLLRVPF